MIFGYFVVSPTDHGKYDVINYQNHELDKTLSISENCLHLYSAAKMNAWSSKDVFYFGQHTWWVTMSDAGRNLCAIDNELDQLI